MCGRFVSQVFDSAIEYLVKTIVSVLSSSTSCKVVRYRKEETLQFGSSSFLPQCSEELIELSKDIIDKLGANGGFMVLAFYLKALFFFLFLTWNCL